MINLSLYFLAIILFWNAIELLVDEYRELPTDSMALIKHLGFNNQFVNQFTSSKGSSADIFYFDGGLNFEEQLKVSLCIKGNYCWKPMRDWPGQYEIRVDGVLKPDGSGWDLWSGELTEEQPFPSYSHFILNTNTNQLHIIVNSGSISDDFVIN